jgi:hypothetical protein
MRESRDDCEKGEISGLTPVFELFGGLGGLDFVKCRELAKYRVFRHYALTNLPKPPTLQAIAHYTNGHGGKDMERNARDFETLRAEIDRRISELVGAEPRRSESGREAERIEARVPSPGKTEDGSYGGAQASPSSLQSKRRQPGPAQTSEGKIQTLEEVERGHILRALEVTNWRVSGPGGAALVLGLNPSTLRSRMKKLGIPLSRSRSH